MDHQGGFTKLELAVLNWYKKHIPDGALSAQIDAARFNHRDWTKVGFYVYLDVPRELKPVEPGRLGKEDWPLTGPDFTSDDIDVAGSALLWGEDGYIDCIEMVSCGEYFKEEVREFNIL